MIMPPVLYFFINNLFLLSCLYRSYLLFIFNYSGYYNFNRRLNRLSEYVLTEIYSTE